MYNDHSTTRTLNIVCVEFTVRHKSRKLKSTRFICDRSLSKHGQSNCAFIRVCAQSKRRLFHACAAEYEKPPADRGDVAKANKVPTRRCDRTDEIRHLTMYYSNRFIARVQTDRCTDKGLLLLSLLSHVWIPNWFREISTFYDLITLRRGAV